jgi:cullin-4
MLAKLKIECGHSFTHNLEQMFKDQALVAEEMKSYNQWLSHNSNMKMSLSVSVLSASAWPSYKDVKVNIPMEVAKQIDTYDQYYKLKHTGRRLTWKHALAHSVVTARFAKGAPKEISVSAFQAIVLLLFNDVKPGEPLSYTTIRDATGLVDAELLRSISSLDEAPQRPRGQWHRHLYCEYGFYSSKDQVQNQPGSTKRDKGRESGDLRKSASR